MTILRMKKLLVPIAVITVVTGCVGARSQPDATASRMTTNAPPVVLSVATNAVTIPDSLAVRLDTETQSNLIRAIEIVLTNVNPVMLNSTVTNQVSFPSSMTVTLGEATLVKLSPQPEAWWKNLLPLISTLLGAIIALFGSYWATTYSHGLQVARQKKQDAEFVRNVLKAIEAELDALSEIFNQGIGSKLKAKKGRMFLVRLALSQDYFTVYGANAVYLGKINPETAKAIISLYQSLKQLIENFRINNEYLQMHDAVMFQWKTTFPKRPDGFAQKGNEIEELLDQQGDELLRLSNIVEQKYDALKQILNEPNTGQEN
jgi:hypothetical protein